MCDYPPCYRRIAYVNRKGALVNWLACRIDSQAQDHPENKYPCSSCVCDLSSLRVPDSYGYSWPSRGHCLFPIPFSIEWTPLATNISMPIAPQLSTGDRFIHDYFIPNVGLRLLWSALWLLLGLAYIFRPLFPSLRSRDSQSSPVDAD